MFRFVKKKDLPKDIYRCTKCNVGHLCMVDKEDVDRSWSHFYKCDRCGTKFLINPHKN